MTQSSFLPPVYLLDSDCVIRLDGKDKVLQGNTPRPPQFTPVERGLIWDGLESLSRDGRLQIIKQVAHELERLYPEGLDRLRGFPHTSPPRVTRDLRVRYQNLLACYPTMVRPYAQRDPADPWLVVTAKKYNYSIVTMELSRQVRASRPRHGPPLPDVCQAEGIHCIDLFRLANDEGWL
jgi:hypothetical protein